MRYLRLMTRDHYTIASDIVRHFYLHKWHKATDACREQVFFMLQTLLQLKTPRAEVLYLSLLRAVRGGELSERNQTTLQQLFYVLDRFKSLLHTLL